MQKYLKRVLKHCLDSAVLVQDIIEEVNDGNERLTLLASSCEAFYNCCIMLRAYYRSYPDEFTEDMIKRMRFILSYSPQKHLRRKLAHRAGLVCDTYDELPF